MDVPENENPKPPKKSARAKRPKKKTLPKISKKECNSEEKTDFETAVRSLSAFFDLHQEDPQREAWERNAKLMCGHVEEYMSNFIIIGYTLNGDPVNITAAKTQKDLDSLSTALQKYVFDCYSKNMFPPGNGPTL